VEEAKKKQRKGLARQNATYNIFQTPVRLKTPGVRIVTKRGWVISHEKGTRQILQAT
jgi:hypothetical protein